MDYVQSTISRMASNSFYLKGWNVTIISAIVALSFKESDWRIYTCALVLNIVFWFLDAYYLKQEALFRKLFEKISKISDDTQVNFSMNTDEFEKDVSAIICNMFNKLFQITPLYSFYYSSFITANSYRLGRYHMFSKFKLKEIKYSDIEEYECIGQEYYENKKKGYSK